MTGVEHLPAFLLAAAAVILIPGPATLFVAGRVRHGARSGAMATFGIVAGDVVLITLSGLGFAALVAQWPVLQDVIRTLGGLYIAYLALEMLNSPPPEVDSGNAPADQGTFGQAMLITLTNPKPILFFAAFFPLFIAQGEPHQMRSFFALGALFELMNLVYFAAVIAIVHRLDKLHRNGHFGGELLNKASAWGLLLCSAFILLM
jgi:leucine efflux protein